MSDAILFAIGCGVTFLCLGGSYVWMRSGYRSEVKQEGGSSTVEQPVVRT